ncbi:hypothetical protein [Gordonia soli]|uniref:hypothetical protein n=1 Tax=Gordonia soli TaxID=320799 RepID=UPI00058CAE39|nr:hypothetical protein [Gordonia soli]
MGDVGIHRGDERRPLPGHPFVTAVPAAAEHRGGPLGVTDGVGEPAPALIAGVVAVISLVGAVGCVMAVRAINRRDGTAYTIFTV